MDNSLNVMYNTECKMECIVEYEDVNDLIME